MHCCAQSTEEGTNRRARWIKYENKQRAFTFWHDCGLCVCSRIPFIPLVLSVSVNTEQQHITQKQRLRWIGQIFLILLLFLFLFTVIIILVFCHHKGIYSAVVIPTKARALLCSLNNISSLANTHALFKDIRDVAGTSLGNAGEVMMVHYGRIHRFLFMLRLLKSWKLKIMPVQFQTAVIVTQKHFWNYLTI